MSIIDVVLQQFARLEMTTKLKDRPALADSLIPKNFPVGCKRPT